MKEVVLSNEELDIIDRLQNSQFPSAGYDPYEVRCGNQILHNIQLLVTCDHGRTILISRALDCRAGGCGSNSGGWTNTQDVEITEK